MSNSPIHPDARDLFHSLPLRFDISWAGVSKLPGSDVCFGLEDGSLLFANLDGTIIHNRFNKASRSNEAINGVAFIQNFMCVSTRNEVMQWTLNGNSPSKMLGAQFPIGAHGVVASSNGYFFAPTGNAGIMFFKPLMNEKPEVTITGPASGQIYIYKLCTQQAQNGAEIVACAARRGGVTAMEFHTTATANQLSTFTFDDLDVVDVCSLPKRSNQASVVALSKNGTIIYFRDVLKDRNPLTVSYNTITGTAYRILAVRNHLFVMTSEGLYIVANLLDHFANGANGSPAVRILTATMDAVDVNVLDDRWVMIVLANDILRFDAALLDSNQWQQSSNATIHDVQSTIKVAVGKHQDLEQSSTPMAIVA